MSDKAKPDTADEAARTVRGRRWLGAGLAAIACGMLANTYSSRSTGIAAFSSVPREAPAHRAGQLSGMSTKLQDSGPATNPRVVGGRTCIFAGGAAPTRCCNETAVRWPSGQLESPHPIRKAAIEGWTHAKHNNADSVGRARCAVDVPSGPTVEPTPGAPDGFDGGGRWYVERVGPFHTLPGERLEYTDHGKNRQKHGAPTVTALFDELGSDGLTAITGREMGVVDDDGNHITYPPIHVHHFLLRGLYQSVVYEPERGDDPGPDWIEHKRHGKKIYVADAPGGVAGISLAIAADDERALGKNATVAARTTRHRTDFGRFPFIPPPGQSTHLRLGAVIEDARPATKGSLPVRWWLLVALRGTRVPGPASMSAPAPAFPIPGFKAPFSMLKLSFMRDMVPSHNEGGMYSTMPSPAHQESYAWASSRMPMGGNVTAELLAVKSGRRWHHHAYIGRESLLLVGTAEQLGLARGTTRGEKCSAAPSKAGFSNNAELRDDLLARLPAIATAWDGPEHLRPQLICHGWGAPEEVIDGRLYDRIATTECTPFRFTGDTVMTELYFAAPHAATEDTRPSATATAHSHSRWDIPFVADDGFSHGFQYAESNTKLTDPKKCRLWWL